MLCSAAEVNKPCVFPFKLKDITAYGCIIWGSDRRVTSYLIFLRHIIYYLDSKFCQVWTSQVIFGLILSERSSSNFGS